MVDLLNIPNALAAGFTNWGQTAGQNIVAGQERRRAQQERNALSAALPGALANDPEALKALYAASPEYGIKVQSYLGEQAKEKRKISAAEFDALDDRITKALGNTKDDAEAAALWPKLHAYASQALGGSDALAVFQQHYTPEYDPSYRMMAVKPGEAYTLGEGQQRFGSNNELIASGAPKDNRQDMPYWMNPDGSVDQAKFAAAQQYARSGASSINNFGAPVQGIGPDGKPAFARFTGNSVAPEIVSGFRPAPSTATAPTEDMSKAAGWYQQAMKASTDIDAAMATDPRSSEPSLLAETLGGIPVVGEAAKNKAYTPGQQQYQQAISSFSEAVLRAATGAGVNRDEALQKVRELTPRPGESKAVRDQKAASRTVYLDSLKLRAGRALGNGEVPSAGAANPNVVNFADLP